MDKSILRCYLVAGTQDCRHLPQYDASQPQQTLLERLEQALKAGITCYQFREKGQFSLQDPQQIEQLARQCQHLCKQYNVPFIMNNDVQLAEKLHADGTHVGQKDFAVDKLAQQIQGKMLIGLSVNTLQQAQQHNAFNGVDYYGCGPIFPTLSKVDAAPDVGINFVQFLREQGINKPLVAIGGIRTEHVPALLQAGADGVAVISTIMQSANITATVKQILNA